MSITRNRRLVLPLLLATGAALSGCTPSAEAKPESAASPSGDPASAEHAEWSYSGDNGPEAWGEVAEQCTDTSDSEQSPIDLDAPAEETKGTEQTDGAAASAPVFDYRPTAMNVVNNGHAIQADPADPDAEGAATNTLTLDGSEYTLAQFHLHALSEHTVEGDHADMELHLVHEDADGELAVVAVFLDQGAENPTLDPVFTSMPSEVAGEEETGAALAEPIDLGALVPEDSAASRYDGSLTTPPCSEGVEWIVMDEPLTVSKEQLAEFRDLYAANNRPVQSLHDREVTTVAP